MDLSEETMMNYLRLILDRQMEEAFRRGTIFPELYKPFTGRRCVK